MPSLQERLAAAVAALKQDLTPTQIESVLALIRVFIDADARSQPPAEEA